MMITKKFVVLVVADTTTRSYLEKFEALKEITNFSNASDVWKLNKTPFILDGNFKKADSGGTTCIEVEKDYFSNLTTEDFIDLCHSNGFECGEYKTGKVYNTAEERCILCELANHQGITSTLAKYNEHVEREVDCIIYESPRFYVVPELGSLVQGFFMIIPKEHYLSVAQFPDGIIAEYHQVCCDVQAILRGTFNSSKYVVFFEHGSGPSGFTSHKKSIVHAHTHVVVDFRLEQRYLDTVQMEPIEDIKIAKNVHYFSYQENYDGQLYISMNPDVYVQRQYPRQVMAEMLNLAPGQYNWRNVSFAENIKASLYRVYKYLKNDVVSSRIKERTIGFVEGYEKRDDFRAE